MAGETLRDLVVSLSLDSDNFSRNIKSVNAQMKEAEAAFKLAGAGIQNFENSMAGTAAKLDLVRTKYTLQEKAVQQFSRAMQAAENKLVTSKATYDKHARALQEAGVKVKEASENARIAKEQFDAVSKATGKNSQAAIEAKAEWNEYKKALADAKDEQKKIQGDLDRAAKSMQNNADAVTKASAALKENEARLKALGIQMGTLEAKTYNVGAWFSSFAAEAEIAGRTLETAGRGLTRYVTTPLAALGAMSAKASIDFETAFVGVRKTVDATETQYRRMAGAIKEMSGEVADSAVNISGVVATAGQLGIVNDEIMSFTRTVQDLTVSTEDLKGTAAAEEIAKFANVAQMSQKYFSNLGSTLTYLGNNYATTEGAIMSMALNLASAGSQAGLSEAQILGFAAALSSVGLEAEKGGTAMSKALKMMEVAAVEGGQALEDFAKVSGMTEEQFKAVWESDPAGAFMAFIEGLARMDDEGISAIATMNEIGFAEVRLSDTILRTVNAHDLVNSALSDANTAWEENVALTEEADKFYGTTESRLKNLGNRAQNFATRLGDGLNPQMEALMGMADGLLSSLENLDGAQMRTITRVGMWAAAVGPLSLGMGKLVTATGNGTNAMGKFLKSVTQISAQAKAANTSFLSVASSTLGFKAGIAGLSVALISGAAALVYYTSNAYKTKAAIESMQDTVNDWKNTPTDTLFGGEGMSFFGLDESAFKDMDSTAKTMEEWRDGLIKVWTDGQKETNAIVDEWTGSFKTMTDDTRQQLIDLKENTGGENSLVAADIDEDLAALDELDQEITALLKKRQNGLFTEDDMELLQETINKREAIVVKYQLEPAEGKGYEQIVQGVNDEINRANVEGRGVDFTVYEEATLAAAQGYSLITDELEAQYDAQRRILEAEGDQEKLAALDAEYLEKRKKAAEEYAKVLSEVAGVTLESEGAQKAEQDIQTLTDLLNEYEGAENKKSVIEKIDEALAGMDKSAMVEYVALLTQVKDAVETGNISEADAEKMFGVDYDEAIKNLGTIWQYIQDIQGADYDEINALRELIGETLFGELETVYVQLDRDDLVRQLDEFEKSPDSVVELKYILKPISGEDYTKLTTDEYGVNTDPDAQKTKNVMDKVALMMESIQKYYEGEFGVEELNNSLDDMTLYELKALGEFVAGIMERIESGEGASAEEIEALGEIILLLNQINALTGDAEGAGLKVAQAVSGALVENDWETTAQTVGKDLADAFKRITGENFYEIGAQATRNFVAGALSEKELVANAGAAILGAYTAGLINPGGTGTPLANNGDVNASADSHMGMVGGAMIKSLGLGALKEAPNQARIIGNAARYISTAAGRGIIGGGAYAAGMSTYNQQQTVNLTGNTFNVQSEQDLHQLAYEIAAIMQRRQRGYGG